MASITIKSDIPDSQLLINCNVAIGIMVYDEYQSFKIIDTRITNGNVIVDVGLKFDEGVVNVYDVILNTDDIHETLVRHNVLSTLLFNRARARISHVISLLTSENTKMNQ